MNFDEDRLIIKSGVGVYNSAVQNKAWSNGASRLYYIKLETFYAQDHYLLLNDTHNVQLRTYCDNLNNIACLGQGFAGNTWGTATTGCALGS